MPKDRANDPARKYRKYVDTSRPNRKDVFDAVNSHKITSEESTDLLGGNWDTIHKYSPIHTSKEYINTVHRNAGLDTSKKDW